MSLTTTTLRLMPILMCMHEQHVGPQDAQTAQALSFSRAGPHLQIVLNVYLSTTTHISKPSHSKRLRTSDFDLSAIC